MSTAMVSRNFCAHHKAALLIIILILFFLAPITNKSPLLMVYTFLCNKFLALIVTGDERKNCYLVNAEEILLFVNYL